MLDKIKRYKWRILLLGDLIAIWQILHLNIYIHHTDINLSGGGSWCSKLWLFICQGINRDIGRPSYIEINNDLLHPLYLLGLALFLLGIFLVKAWNEQKKEILKN